MPSPGRRALAAWNAEEGLRPCALGVLACPMLRRFQHVWPFRLGLKLRDPERSLLDMAEAMLALGAVVPSGEWQPRDEL